MAISRTAQRQRIKRVIRILIAARGTVAADMYDQSDMERCAGNIVGAALWDGSDDYDNYDSAVGYFAEETRDIRKMDDDYLMDIDAMNLFVAGSNTVFSDSWVATKMVFDRIESTDNRHYADNGPSALEVKIAQFCDLIGVEYDGYINMLNLDGPINTEDEGGGVMGKMEARKADIAAEIQKLTSQLAILTTEHDELEHALKIAKKYIA